MRNWRQFAADTARSEVAAVLVMMVIVAVVSSVLAFVMDRPVPASGKAPANPCASADAAAAAAPASAAAARASGPQVVVADSSTDNGTMAVFTDRNDDAAERQSTQLAVEDGSLKPDECLGTSVSDLARPDGQSIPGSQVSSWAETDNTGTRVTVYLEVSPRYGTVTPAGGYMGNVYLDDVRATGGNVPVDIHVAYPYVWRAAMLCFAAAWAGFFWAWLVNLTKPAVAPPPGNMFWLYIVLQLAVLVVVPLSVLDALVLTNPDWAGSVTQYVILAILAGGGALATTPTLRALVDKAVIPLARGSRSPAGAAPPEAAEIPAVPVVPAISAGSLAGAPAGGDGGSLPAPPAPPKPPVPPAPREPMEM